MTDPAKTDWEAVAEIFDVLTFVEKAVAEVFDVIFTALQFVEENPLSAVLMAFGLGLVVGGLS